MRSISVLLLILGVLAISFLVSIIIRLLPIIIGITVVMVLCVAVFDFKLPKLRKFKLKHLFFKPKPNSKDSNNGTS